MTGIRQIQEVLIGIYGDDVPLVGEPANEIRRAEARLGFALPKLLREYYGLTGHADFVNSSCDRLVGAEELEVNDGALVFYDDNQSVACWGILKEHLLLDDPPVQFAATNGALSWDIHHPTLSSFLIMMAYWQAVNGALPNVALAQVGKSVQEKIAQEWLLLHRFENDKMYFFGGEGVVLSLLGGAGHGELQVGTRTAEQLRRVDQMLGIEWSLFETDDV